MFGIRAVGFPSILTSLALSLREAPAPLRTVEALRRGWEEIQWADLKAGTVFRLREPDGTLADEGTPHEVCVALTDAQPAKEVAWSLQCEAFTEVDQHHKLDAQVLVYREGELIGGVRKLDFRRLIAFVPVPDEEEAEVGFDQVQVRFA